MVQTVQKTIETQQLQCIDNVSDIPVVSVVPAPQVQVSEKTVEISQLQAAEKIVETRGTQTIQSTQTSEKLGTAPVCRSTQAEIVEAVEIGALLPAESAVLVPVAVPKTFNSPRVQLIDRVVRHSRDGTETCPIRSESSEDRGDVKSAVLGRTRGHASRRTTSGAHDPERAEDCGGATDPVH